MLSTSTVQSESTGSSIKKTLSPGNHVVRIYDMELVKGYNQNSLQVLLRVEGPDMGPDFDGFLFDKNNPGGGKFSGQVGRVRLTNYAFEDGVTKGGKVVNRDQSILQALDRLAMCLGVRQAVADIKENTIHDLFAKAKPFLTNGALLNVCIAAKEYTNKAGYKDFDLFLPYAKDKKYPFEAADANPSNLIEYDANVHVIKEKAAKPVESFEPAAAAENDFDFNID